MPTPLLSRQDLEMLGGQNATYEWQLFKPDGTPYDLTNDTVELYLSKGSNVSTHLKKTSAPGTHYAPTDGIVRFTFTSEDVPFARTQRVWWYEIWRTPAGQPTVKKPHIVGELQIRPSVRVT